MLTLIAIIGMAHAWTGNDPVGITAMATYTEGVCIGFPASRRRRSSAADLGRYRPHWRQRGVPLPTGASWQPASTCQSRHPAALLMRPLYAFAIALLQHRRRVARLRAAKLSHFAGSTVLAVVLVLK
jgi:hypothetical protein